MAKNIKYYAPHIDRCIFCTNENICYAYQYGRGSQKNISSHYGTSESLCAHKLHLCLRIRVLPIHIIDYNITPLMNVL
jgi:hypothetical protein